MFLFWRHVGDAKVSKHPRNLSIPVTPFGGLISQCILEVTCPKIDPSADESTFSLEPLFVYNNSVRQESSQFNGPFRSPPFPVYSLLIRSQGGFKTGYPRRGVRLRRDSACHLSRVLCSVTPRIATRCVRYGGGCETDIDPRQFIFNVSPPAEDMTPTRIFGLIRAEPYKGTR